MNIINYKKFFKKILDKLMLVLCFIIFFISTVALLERYIDIYLFIILSLTLLFYVIPPKFEILVFFILLTSVFVFSSDSININNHTIFEFFEIILAFLIGIKLSNVNANGYIKTFFVTLFCILLNTYVNIFIFPERMKFNVLSDMILLYYNFLLGGWIFLLKIISLFNQYFYLKMFDVRITFLFLIKNILFLLIVYLL